MANRRGKFMVVFYCAGPELPSIDASGVALYTLVRYLIPG